MKIRPLFAWYDLRVGVYWDRKGRKLYILPLPMVGVVLDFSRPVCPHRRVLESHGWFIYPDATITVHPGMALRPDGQTIDDPMYSWTDPTGKAGSISLSTLKRVSAAKKKGGAS